MAGFGNLNSLKQGKRSVHSGGRSNRTPFYYNDEQVCFLLCVFFFQNEDNEYFIDQSWVIQGVNQDGKRININDIADFATKNNGTGIIKKFNLIGFDMSRKGGWKNEQEDKTTSGITAVNIEWFEQHFLENLLNDQEFQTTGIKYELTESMRLFDMDSSDYRGTKFRLYDPLAIKKTDKNNNDNRSDSESPFKEEQPKKKFNFGSRG